MKISICIVTHNHGSCISDCINSIYSHINISNFEIIIVDDNSVDNTIDMLNQFEKLNNFKYFINSKSKSLSHNNNFAASEGEGDIFLFLNPDIILTAESNILLLTNYLENNTDVGCLACLLKYPDNSIQESFRKFQSINDFITRGLTGKIVDDSIRIHRNHINNKMPFETDWLLGAFLMFPKSFFNLLGGFDLRYRLYYEDVDMGYRVKKQDKKNILHPGTFVIHNYNRSSASRIFTKYKFYHISSFLKFRIKFYYNQLKTSVQGSFLV
ncbi:glycosyltransferase family 2 protein [archaeon]|nr:glycosyltransferase family 2 protein [archaeon]